MKHNIMQLENHGGHFYCCTCIVLQFQNVTFTISGENLTSRMRSLLFKSMLRQDIGWFDNLRNNTAALTNRLSYDASEVQGVRGGGNSCLFAATQ